MLPNLYYSEFAGETFVIQAESEAVDNAQIARAILQGIGDLLKHEIRVVFVFGKGRQFEKELRADFGARQHPETNRLIIPEKALPRILDERRRIAREVEDLCRAGEIPFTVFPESLVRAERRITHQSTGIVLGIDIPAIEATLERPGLAIVGFGGQDDRQRFLHVPSVSLAADLAVELRAQKLLFLNQNGGIFVPGPKRTKQQLSFADLEELLCLLQKKDRRGRLVLSGPIVPKVHGSIRAIAGGVGQAHIVSYNRMLDEILTRTGAGTMIERHQSHHVDYAREEDLDEVERLHVESQRYATDHGTPYVKPLDRRNLERLLPQTLLLKHRGIVVGKLHATPVPGAADALLIGGFVIGENHQDSQQGQLLVSEAMSRFRQTGYGKAAAITASPRAKRVFEQNGGVPTTGADWQAKLLENALQRYHGDERDEVQLFEFTLTP
jgi:amino-acid N-acetyltransferase